MALSLILDILLASLLVVTIGYAIMLNKRLDALRSDKDELRRLAGDFERFYCEMLIRMTRVTLLATDIVVLLALV